MTVAVGVAAVAGSRNPFRPITLDLTWLTPSVVQLAEQIYNDGAIDQMPILADELEKAGCLNQEILGHCRGSGSHVRGCWVVDLVLVGVGETLINKTRSNPPSIDQTQFARRRINGDKQRPCHVRERRNGLAWR